MAIPAIHRAMAPSKVTTLRCSAMRPATSALRPSSAARLNTFDPSTTPTPTSRSPRSKAVTAAVTSGVSAASAAASPSIASGAPRRAPSRSSRVTRRALAAKLAAEAAMKKVISQASFTLLLSRPRPGRQPRPRGALVYPAIPTETPRSSTARNRPKQPVSIMSPCGAANSNGSALPASSSRRGPVA